MFWAWAHGRLATPLALRPQLADIQELNRLALTEAPLSLTKVSASTYLNPKVRRRYRLLKVGAALGRGCGPLVVSREPWSFSHPTPLKLAVPGLDTTACRLARMALQGQVKEWVELRYDEVMPAVRQGAVDAGVIIHESRFSYQSQGLRLALDLGSWWEEQSGLPLPLGVMLARNDLDERTVLEVERILSESIRRAWQLFEAPGDGEGEAFWSYLRDNAVELDDSTIRAHIQLYVNEYSLDLQAEGRRALDEFSRRVER